MTTPNHQTTAEAILAQTGPLGFDAPADALPPAEAAEVVTAAPVVEAPEVTSDAPDAAEGADAPPKRPSWSSALESVKELDPGAADLMKGMHADYTKKTQELAALRKELQAERAALLSVRQDLPEDMPQYDPWDEASVMARVERAAQERINQMTEAVQREYEARQAEQSYQDAASTLRSARAQGDVGERINAAADRLERLASLIPPPRKHQLRYHGIYAPNSRFQAVVKRMTAEGERALRDAARRRRHTYWVLWAELLKRTFQVDVSRCPQSLSWGQGTMQRVSLIQTPEAIAALLTYDEDGEEARGPPRVEGEWG